MSEFYSSDPYITWAAVWAASRETGPCKSCRRRRLVHWAVRGVVIATGLAVDLFIAHKMGVIR
jgi:hypothetical protein